eukprot:85796-Chlamydomonas_euryale.AAC.1
MAFGPGGSLLAAVLASGHLVVFDVAAGRPAEWSLANDADVARCLEKLPGSPAGVSFRPAPPGSDGCGGGGAALL